MAGGFGSFVNDLVGTGRNFVGTVTNPNPLFNLANPVATTANTIKTLGNFAGSVGSTVNDIMRPSAKSGGGNQPNSTGNTSQQSVNNSPVFNDTGTGGGGGGGTAGYSPSEISAIDSSLANTLADYFRQFTNSKTQNEASDKTAENIYRDQVRSNDQSHEQSIHNVMTAAALGSQGLRSVLASLGALGGTGSVLANRAVANTANNDIGSADNTYQTNANQVESAWTTAQNAKKARDLALDSAYNSNVQDAKNKAVQSKMDIYKSAGATDLYRSLLPNLVATTAPTTPIAANPVVYNPANVSTFAPASKLNVSTSGGSTTPTNSALFTVKKKSD